MNEKIYAFGNEEKNETGNETIIQQKKFLDAEGVKYLWSKINMQDYPNNQTLMQVIEAIDETKADINLQNIELTDEEINELKFKLKIPESLNYIYLGDTTSGYGYMCNMLNGIENYMMIPPQYEQSHPNALSEMLAGMSAAIMQTSNKLYKNILPRITLNYPKLREAGMGIFIQFYFYTYHKNKKQCGSVEAVGLYYNTKNDIYQLSRISKINSLVSYGFLKFDGNNNVLYDATERFDDTFTNDYVPASSGAIGRALNEKANKSDLFSGSWDDLKDKPFGESRSWYETDLITVRYRLHYYPDDGPVIKAIIDGIEYTEENLELIPLDDGARYSIVTSDGKYRVTFDYPDSNHIYEPDVVWQYYYLESSFKQLPTEYLHYSVQNTILEADRMIQERPDWNENSEYSYAYIKNRPFYTDYQYETFIGETTITTNSSYYCFLDSLMSFGDDTIGVMWDGTMYQCQYYDYSYNGGYTFGDSNLVNYPFYFYADYGSGYIKGNYGEHTYSLHKISETINQIDEKYIPDTIARASEIKSLPQADWNQNDDTKLDYIKNKPDIDEIVNSIDNKITYDDYVITLPTLTEYPHWQSMAYGNGKFVAISTATDKVAYSEDGIVWTEVETITSSDSGWYSIAYGNGKFVVIDYTTNNVVYSEDGIIWQKATMPYSDSWQSITYGDGKFVAINYNSSIAAYSTDGITWEETTMSTASGWQSITYGDGKFVAIAKNPNVVAYSTDGITWEETGTTLNNYIWKSISYGNGKFVAVTANGWDVAYSEDGITWEETRTLPRFYVSITYGDGKFVAISADGIAAYSEDGIVWTEVDISSSYNWRLVTYECNKFIALAEDGIVAYSEDGIIWSYKIKSLTQNSKYITENVKEILGVLDLDSSLSVLGAAADAKAVGDIIAQKSQVQIITWEADD